MYVAIKNDRPYKLADSLKALKKLTKGEDIVIKEEPDYMYNIIKEIRDDAV